MTSTHLLLPDIPSCTWQRSIGQGWESPYTVRYASNLDDGPFHGMPLGGFGAGCIGRSHRGDFNLWHIDGGEHVFRPIPGCQFSVFEQVGDERQAYALCTEAPEDSSLGAWRWYPQAVGSQESEVGSRESGGGEQTPGEEWGEEWKVEIGKAIRDSSGTLPPDQSKLNPQTSKLPTGTYHALYPRSWFVYQNVFQAELTCEQFSPIWAHSYRETSYPVAMFLWTAHNPTRQPITLSIMLSWQNLVGWFTNTLKSPQVQVRDDGSPVYEYQPRWEESEGNFNLWVADHDRVGCLLDYQEHHELPQEGDGQWAIAATMNPYKDEVFYHTRWNPAGDGADLWHTFANDGSLADCFDESPAQAGEQIGAAFAIRFTLEPGETRQIPFTVTWDFPVTEFAEGVTYYRRYTDFFGRNGGNSWAIARNALRHYPQWRESIQTWQQPILNREDLPDWFKLALFNELYDLTDGATLWTAADERDPIGQFAVAECLDYRWYESLDVRLYGSFALVMLFPELEKAVLRAFARAIPTSDPTPRTIGYYFTIGAESPQAVRKAANATPHDLGAPNEHPWEKTNYTSYQDCNLWKDLGSDFVLQVYRDFVLTGSTDTEFLQDCWPSVIAALAYLKDFDLDGDGIPENSGAPDQTFDDWRLQGISAYCGGLWIAALEAAIAIGTLIDPENPVIADYQTWLAQARPLYQETLWNGQYYRLDSGSGSDVVMADQLCGQFYAQILDLPDVVPPDCARSALKTVYEACFLNFQDGIIGAANGLLPDGSPVNPQDTHPLEVWTGINFGIAAFLTQLGMETDAFRLTEAVVRQIYDNGLQFRTPEAITANGTFRASHYLRAMAIWAIYGVITDFH
jgi:non-lysosomal glucosylceramidase